MIIIVCKYYKFIIICILINYFPILLLSLYTCRAASMIVKDVIVGQPPCAKAVQLYPEQGINRVNSCLQYIFFFLNLAFLICKVLTKNIEEVSISYNLNVPTNKYDTTSGNNGRVYVKFDDYSFYPEYIVYYSNVNE